MKLTKRTLRLSLVAAVTAAVSLPLLNQIRNNRATGQTPDPALPAAQPKGLPVGGFAPVDPSKVVLSVGDLKVTASEFNAFVSELDPQLQARVFSSPAAKRQLAEQFIDLKLMANEAKRMKLDETTRVKTTYEQLLANALIVSLTEQTAANKKFYDDNKEWFTELQARHILIGVTGSGITGANLTENQAKAKADDIKKRLDKGEDFAALARNESDDKGSAPTGGSLGTVTRGQMVPPFEKAAFLLKDNEISFPIKTQYGYHIIQVLSRAIPAFEQASQRIPRHRLELILDDLKKSQKPELDEVVFGPGDAPKAAATQPTTAPATAPAAAPVK